MDNPNTEYNSVVSRERLRDIERCYSDGGISRLKEIGEERGEMGEKMRMKDKKEEKPEYKNRVVFLRLSKGGDHVYAFNRDGALGEKVSSLIMNVKDIRAVIDGKGDWAKVSVLEVKEEEG